MCVFCVADIPALVPWQPADDGDHPDRDELSPWHRRRTGRRSIHHHHPSPPKMPMVFEVFKKCTEVLSPAIYHDLNPSKLGETSFANGFDVLPRSLTSMKTQHMHFTNRKIRNSVQKLSGDADAVRIFKKQDNTIRRTFLLKYSSCMGWSRGVRTATRL